MAVNKSEWSQLFVVSKKKKLQTDLLSSYDGDDVDDYNLNACSNEKNTRVFSTDKIINSITIH